MFIILRLEIIFDTLKRLIVDKIPTQFNLPAKKCFICISRCGLINGWLNEIAVFPILTYHDIAKLERNCGKNSQDIMNEKSHTPLNSSENFLSIKTIFLTNQSQT